ncbi:DUF2332 family protein [Macrococcoides caseolyticum]|uniref:DUF2332 family protein n=1 Tax=Macrococcoides caseolyticum TaxID=69966 RepID=UPI001F16F369|nr:DUF2332 family protein [Macrococcus caseolyticus]MCE4957189.1 DUF2332 family protein [Macrococcus caseolyticus]
MPEQIKKHFEAYSEAVKEDSPLYSYITKHLAQDEQFLLKIQPHFFNARFISLFLASVIKHLYTYESDLRDYFLNFTNEPKKPSKEMMKQLLSFQDTHFSHILKDIENYNLKKNIVERSSVLIPVIQHIIKISGQDQFNVIELGSKGGLLLNYDWYGYTFNKKTSIGNTDDFNIKVKLNGYDGGFDISEMPHPHIKKGITQNKIDLSVDDDYFWLLSLYYPEETKRRKHFMKARKIFLDHPVEILEGDELALLNETLSALPQGEAVILFHVHVTKNWSDEKKQALMALISTYSKTHEIYHVHHQIFNNDIYLDAYQQGQLQRQKLAHFDLNELTIDWLHNQKVIF